MDQNKQLNEEIRRQFVGEYGKRDCEIDRTTSCPDGLHETSRFLPDLHRPVRRTDSFDDIERHKLYFDLVQKNRGKEFTWKHYCNTLLADLRNYDDTASLNKVRIQSSATPFQRDAVNFGTAAGTASSTKKLPENHMLKRKSFLSIHTNVEIKDEKFQTPSKNVLKKMCTEIRTLAQKTCKTVEKMATPTKYCSACGDIIRGTAMHKTCPKQGIKQKDCKIPTTPGMPRSSNSITSRAINFQSPTMTPAFVLDQRTKKLGRKPIFKL